MTWLNDILANLGKTIAIIVLVFTGATVTVPAPVDMATSTATTTQEVISDASSTIPVQTIQVPSNGPTQPVVIIPIYLPTTTQKAVEVTPDAPQPVYNAPMPTEPACVEEVKITQFIIPTANSELNGTSTKAFSFVMRGTSKCSDTFDVEFTSDVKIHSFDDQNKMIFGPDTYSAKTTIKSNIKTADGYVINSTVTPGYIIQRGTYHFKVKILKDGIEQATEDATLTI